MALAPSNDAAMAENKNLAWFDVAADGRPLVDAAEILRVGERGASLLEVHG